MNNRPVPLYKTLQEWMYAYDIEKIEDIFENGHIKSKPLYEKHGSQLTHILKAPLYTMDNSYVVQYLNKNRNYNEMEAQNVQLQVPFSEIERLYGASFQRNPYQPLYKNFPIFVKKYQNSAFQEKIKFTVLLKGKIGVYKNCLANSGRYNINIRALETNIVQFLSTEFPYSAVVNFSNQTIFITHELNDYFQFMLPPSCISDDIDFVIKKFKASSQIKLKGWCDYNSFVQSTEHSQLQVACASYLCIKCQLEEIEKVKEWAISTIGFLPAIYLLDNTTNLPSYIPYKSNYITFSDYEKLNNPPEINCTTTEEGIKIMTWNLQNQSTLAFPNSLNVCFPFTSWQSYKYEKIAKLILKSQPDICCFSEAGPINDIFETYPEIKKNYNLTKCEIDSTTKLSPGNSIYSAVLTSKKYKLLHAENIPFSILAFNVCEAKKLGVKNPNLENISKFSSFNSASFAVVEINGKNLAVCGIYPNWQFTTEVMKYLQIKLACDRVSELFTQFNCSGKIVAGDFNMRPASGIYQSFTETISAKNADQLNQIVIEEGNNNRKYAQNIQFQGVVDDLRIEGYSSAFRENVSDDVEGSNFKEPITTNVEDFRDCLDYIMTDLKIKQKCKPYCEICDDILPNSVCVSDHAPLICVADFK